MSTEAGSSTDEEPAGPLSYSPNADISFYTRGGDMIFGEPRRFTPTAAVKTAPGTTEPPVQPITPTDVARGPSNVAPRRKRTYNEATKSGPAINEAPTQKLHVAMCSH